MDGPHDLGGKQGFGPIETDAPAFRYDWEERAWALTKTAALFSVPGIDAWRHGIENMDPLAYMSEPYFVKWTLNNASYAILEGKFSAAELFAGAAETLGAPAASLDMGDVLARLKANNIDFRRDVPMPARFAVGDTVITNRAGHSGHTRLPGYARAAQGTVVTAHDGYAFADRCADGEEQAEHLYSVEFQGNALWGDEAEPGTSVVIDLWESYLDPA